MILKKFFYLLTKCVSFILWMWVVCVHHTLSSELIQQDMYFWWSFSSVVSRSWNQNAPKSNIQFARYALQKGQKPNPHRKTRKRKEKHHELLFISSFIFRPFSITLYLSQIFYVDMHFCEFQKISGVFLMYALCLSFSALSVVFAIKLKYTYPSVCWLAEKIVPRIYGANANCRSSIIFHI